MKLDELPSNLSSWKEEELDAAVEARRQEKRRLDLELARLLGSRNDLQPISRLHDELLAAIFAQLHAIVSISAMELLSRHYIQQSYAPAPDWLVLGSVCRRWRDVLISYSAFWSHITATTVEWLDIILTRSVQAPLHVAITHPLWEVSLRTYMRLLQCAADRIETLELFPPPGPRDLDGAVQQIPLPDTSYPLHSLQHLQIYAAYGAEPGDLEPVLRYLDGNVQQYSNLRSISSRCLSWDFLRHAFRPGITILKVSNITAPPSVYEWLDALSQMPELRELSLAFAIASLQRPTKHAVSVTLPHLHTFSLPSEGEDDGPAYVALWDHLLLPKLAHAAVTLEPSSYTSSDMFVQWLASKCSSLNAKSAFISARYSWTYDNIFGSAKPMSFYGPTIALSSGQHLSAGIGGPYYLDENAQSFCASFYVPSDGRPIIQSLPLAQVSTLTVDHTESWKIFEAMLSDIWEPIASSMFNLTTLRIATTRSVTGFFGVMRRSQRPRPNSGLPPTPFLAKLEYLELSEITWTNVLPTEGTAGELADWTDTPGCPCIGLNGDREQCSCMLIDLQNCACQVDTVCDCECRWSGEKLTKVLVEGLRYRAAGGLPRLRQLDIVAMSVENIPGPEQYNIDTLHTLVGKVNIHPKVA